MEKSMLNIKQNERISVRKIKKCLEGNHNMVEICLNRKWYWAGHLARGRGGENWGRKCTFWYLGQEKRNRGRQKIRWTDDFNKMLENKMFHRVATDRVEWQRLRAAFSRSGNKYF